MVRFFQRSVKYFISLTILYFIILYAMSATSMMTTTPAETFNSLIGSSSGLRMVAAMVVLSLAYPFFGYMKRKMKGQLAVHRDAINQVMFVQGFRLLEEREGKMIFVADNFFRRLTLLFEDHVVMTQMGDEIELSGNRKTIAYVIFKLEYTIDKADKSSSTNDSDNND